MKFRSAKLPESNTLVLVLFSAFVLLLVLRQLADPDLGFHLRYGKYIAENLAVPEADISTSGAYGNEYIDSQWLFQLLLYGIFTLSGYSGLSMLVVILAGILAVLLIKALNVRQLAPGILLLVPVIFLIENRLVIRPEVFSFIFIAFFLLVLNQFSQKYIKAIWLLPLVMLLWVNIHSLFIAGIFILFVFFIAGWIRQKRPGKVLAIVLTLSVLVCFANPYGYKMLLFPFGLLSRFSDSNVFNEHIAEFQPFFRQSIFTVSDYLFGLWVLLILVIAISHFKKLSLSILIISGTMLVLAFTAIRNIPLFAITSVFLLSEAFSSPENKNSTSRARQNIIIVASIALLMAIILLIPGNNWYRLNERNTRFGAGVDKTQLPEDASDFILSHDLKGNIINSLGAGGWLSWRLPQKVLIDGRLEVMGEDLYKEVENSFRGELPSLIQKYNGEMIVYNYRRYQPWTMQLRNMPDWKPVFIDGLFAIFIRSDDSKNIPALNDSSIVNSLTKHADWDEANAGMFCLQYGFIDAASVLLQKASAIRSEDWIKQALNQVRQIEHSYKQPGETNLRSGRAQSEVHLKRGNELFSQGKTEEAASEFRLAIQSDSTYAKAYNNLGNILAMQNDLEKALILFNKAIELDENYADAFFGRGSCYYYMGKNKKACSDWEKASALGNSRANEFIKQFCR